MREVKSKLSVIWVVILGTSVFGMGIAFGAVVCSIALVQVAGPITTNANAGPLPPPVRPPNEINLTPAEQLGKFMLYDHTLSNPPGYACATCHVREAGFTRPDSAVSLVLWSAARHCPWPVL
jgi:cytochrome c peroxidase